MDPNYECNLFRDRRVIWAAIVTLAVLALFLLAQTLVTFKEYKYVGDMPDTAPTIGVQGRGEVFVKPDTTQFSFSVSEDGKTTAEASKKTTDKINIALGLVKAAGVEEENIKTLAYDVYPKTVYDPVPCPINSSYCPPSKPREEGFTVAQSIEVKMKDAQKAGALLTQLADAGVQNVSGLSFTVEDEEVIKAQARDAAIKNAQKKAQVLARSLGVHIVRIISFSEDGSPMPYYKGMLESAADGRGAAPVEAALPQGENQFVSNVSITYEIR